MCVFPLTLCPLLVHFFWTSFRGDLVVLCCLTMLFGMNTNATPQSMSLTEAETLALKILKQVMEEKLNAINVEVCSITPGGGFRIYKEEEVKAIIARLAA